MNFYRYLEKVKDNYRQAVKVEWLNPDESVNFEFTNSLYDMKADVNVNYQNGTRRTCTVVLNNDKNKFPVDFNNIWIGQKFKLWMGIFLDDETPYYLPQGVFYVSNPTEVYNPTTRTMTLNGIDKWAYLDGTLFGRLIGSYQTNVGVNLYDAIKDLLSSNMGQDTLITQDNIEDYFTVENSTYYFKGSGSIFTSNNIKKSSTTATTKLTAKQDLYVDFDYMYSCQDDADKFYLSVGSTDIENGVSGNTTIKVYNGKISKGTIITFRYEKNDDGLYTYEDVCSFSNFKVNLHNKIVRSPIDPISPFLSPYFIGKTTNVPKIDEETGKYEIDEDTGKYITEEKEVLLCPYTATVERGNTYADVILEYATILCANVYYDVNGRFALEPMIDTADDITDTNKEILWHYTVDEKTFLGLTQTFEFEKIHNDFVVLGNILNGYQFKARVQNRNIMSNTCIQRIGLRPKEPYEDNQYVSDEQCKELAIYYAKTDTILQRSGNIDSVSLFHLDVNKLVTISTPNNNMSKELFLITGFSLSTSGTMSLNVTSVNILKDFDVVEVDVYE